MNMEQLLKIGNLMHSYNKTDDINKKKEIADEFKNVAGVSFDEVKSAIKEYSDELKCIQGGGHPLGQETSLEKKLKKLSEELKKEKQLIPIEIDTHNKYSIVNILNQIPKFVETYPEFHVDEQGDCYAFTSNVIFTKGGLTSTAVILLKEEQLIEALKEIGYEFKRKKKKVLTLANLSFLETYQNLLFGESGNLYVNNKYFLPHSRLYVLTLYKDKEINIEHENEKSYVLKIKEANGSNVGSTLFLPKELNDIAYAVKEVE